MTPDSLRALIAHHEQAAQQFGRTAEEMKRVGHTKAHEQAAALAAKHATWAADLRELLEAFQLFGHQALNEQQPSVSSP